jgi:membrane-associated protease RseP (regulator of RpoE activity)
MDDVFVRAPARTRFPAIHVLLFLATVATTLWTGFALAGAPGGVVLGSSLADTARSLLSAARAGLPFAGSLVAILLSHEMGHYVLARRHRVDATLPFFIPFLPFPLGVGTLGAVIRIRSLMPSRRAVLDIGVAGPIAGFVVAVPLLLWGYAHSPAASIDPSSVPLPSGLNLLRHWFGPQAISDGSTIFFGRSLVTMAVLRLAHPELPFGSEVTESPVAIAAWFGLYVTTLNLLPMGQLDGGHVLYALLGRERARAVSRLSSFALLGVGLFVSWTWLGWWVVTRILVGNGHPPALEEKPLGPGRRLVAVLAFALFLATFTPVPIR